MSHPSPRDRCAPQAPAALVSKHSRPTRMALFKASAVCGNCVALTRKVLLTNTYTCMRLSFGKVNADWDEFRPLPRYLARKRSEGHTSELQSLMRISYAVFCLKKNTTTSKHIILIKPT